jgi:mannosyltransferase OCH1-like enzyme
MPIPNKILLTWKDSNLPSYVIDNIKKVNPNTDIVFFDDSGIKEFLNNHYGSEYVDFFNTIKLGYNKGDFFRYCYLYKYGGYYFDIDIEHVLPISEIIEKDTSFFSIISALSRGHIFQAILFSEPNNEIIKNCIDDMFKFGPNPPITPSYIGHTTTCMFNNIYSFLGTIPNEGEFVKNNMKICLGRERMYNNRYICTYKNKLIAFSRYKNYNREMGFVE